MYRYLIVRPGEEEKEVTKEEWIQAERAAGFKPKLASTDPEYMAICATSGFVGQGIAGRIEYIREP
ncbi:hypothetical protein ACI2KR_06830 [Pseudomonas luteola]